MQSTRDRAPERTLAQRMDALAKGNGVRTYRAGLKRELKAGRSARSVAEILRDPRPEEETWKVFELLLSLPKVGRVKASRYLQTCRMSPSKTVGGLSDRQRAELVVMLGGRV